MDAHQQQPSACEELVDALMRSGGQIALIVGHLAEFSPAGRSLAASSGLDAVLRHIATDVLEASLPSVGDDELRAAARIVAQATDALGRELVLLAPDDDLDRRPSPIPRHRRRPL